MTKSELNKITSHLQNGDIIAYPTEGVFGLGCDPLNESAVKKILKLKNRPVEKGLIIIAADWQQLSDWIGDLSANSLFMMQQPTTEPITWVVPASKKVPRWITGIHESIAVRVIQHPIAQAICAAFGGPIVSTSANTANEAPCTTYEETKKLFAKKVAYIVNAPVGKLKKPTQIRNAESGKILRE